MRVSFTGTRKGQTPAQKRTVTALLLDWTPTEAHHGDCVGADDEFANLCHVLTPRPFITAHPGESANGGDNQWRANNPHSDLVLPTKTHFARNRDLVDVLIDEQDTLLVTPCEFGRQNRGGTWFTYDYAVKKGERVIVVWPDGAISFGSEMKK